MSTEEELDVEAILAKYDDISTPPGTSERPPAPGPRNDDPSQHPALGTDETPFRMPDPPAGPTPSAAPPAGLSQLALPDGDGFLARETHLYERALMAYEEVLENGSTKEKMQAAKDVVSIYTGRRSDAIKAAQGPNSTTNNHLHITVDTVKNALASALHGSVAGLTEGTTYERNLTPDDGADG